MSYKQEMEKKLSLCKQLMALIEAKRLGRKTIGGDIIYGVQRDKGSITIDEGISRLIKEIDKPIVEPPSTFWQVPVFSNGRYIIKQSVESKKFYVYDMDGITYIKEATVEVDEDTGLPTKIIWCYQNSATFGKEVYVHEPITIGPLKVEKVKEKPVKEVRRIKPIERKVQTPEEYMLEIRQLLKCKKCGAVTSKFSGSDTCLICGAPFKEKPKEDTPKKRKWKVF